MENNIGKFEQLCKDFNKKFKGELIHKGVSEYSYKRIPFTSPRINYITYGGIPEGKLIEFYGEEHGGKTTTALDIVANYQKLYDRTVLYVDTENTLDTEWAKKLGVNVEELYILSPTNQSAEDIFQFILDAIDTGLIGLCVIDSLGVMVSDQALNKEIIEKTYGGIAMALTNFSKKAEMLCQRTKTTVIGINQMRDDLSSSYGGMTTTGGKAWKHNTSVRMEFRKGTYIDEDGHQLNSRAESPAGNIIQVAMTKNKTCPPKRRTGFYTLLYDTGVDYISDYIDVAIRFGIIKQSGGWYDIINIETGELIIGKLHGINAVKDYLIDDVNKEQVKRITAHINVMISDYNV